jgi:hypothetical protein
MRKFGRATILSASKHKGEIANLDPKRTSSGEGCNSSMSEKLTRIQHVLERPEESELWVNKEQSVSTDRRVNQPEDLAEQNFGEGRTHSQENRDHPPNAVIPERGLSLRLWQLAERFAIRSRFEGESVKEQRTDNEVKAGLITRVEVIVGKVVRTIALSVLRLLLIKYSEAFEALIHRRRSSELLR